MSVEAICGGQQIFKVFRRKFEFAKLSSKLWKFVSDDMLQLVEDWREMILVFAAEVVRNDIVPCMSFPRCMLRFLEDRMMVIWLACR